MVSMINFYQYRDKLKRGIISRLDKLDSRRDFNDLAWIAYALAQDGEDNNPFFRKAFCELKKWAGSEEAGNQDRHLAPLCIYAYFEKNGENKHEALKKINLILKKLFKKEIYKFSPLNDPEQVFCISLISKHLSDKNKGNLSNIISKNMKGKLTRKILYIASLIELGNKDIKVPEFEKADFQEDLITLLWFYERYKNIYKTDLTSLWKTIDNIKAIISFDDAIQEDLINISNRSISLLYEAVCKECREPDPNMMFDVFPIHERIKELSEKYFKKENYVVAVEQATKVLNEFIQEKSGVKDKSEAELVQSTMKNINDPDKLKIKFNKFLNENSGKNEQIGLALIAEGVFKAFRNPKGHKHERHPLVKLDAYEALCQLIIISYLMERIERAEK
jgi:uncharacterized protein (TIGR02391 family)